MTVTSPLLSLGDQLWLIGHDENTGKSRVADDVLHLGLSAALLGELVFYSRIGIDKTRKLVVRSNRQVGELVADDILAKILHEFAGPAQSRTLGVRMWLSYLRQDDYAYTQVGERLLAGGMVTSFQERRGLFRSVTRYRVRNVNYSLKDVAGIASKIRARQPIREWDVVFAALVEKTGLQRIFQPDATTETRTYLRGLVEGLPTSLRFLIEETEAAIGQVGL